MRWFGASDHCINACSKLSRDGWLWTTHVDRYVYIGLLILSTPLIGHFESAAFPHGLETGCSSDANTKQTSHHMLLGLEVDTTAGASRRDIRRWLWADCPRWLSESILASSYDVQINFCLLAPSEFLSTRLPSVWKFAIRLRERDISRHCKRFDLRSI